MADDPRLDLDQLLTPRQRTVLELLRRGLTNAEIAEQTGLSAAGVSYHITEIINKLGVHNRHEAAAWPDRPPWWATATAPVTLFWRKASAALPAKLSSAAMATSGGMFIAAFGGLALIGFLLARGGDAGATTGDTLTPPPLETSAELTTIDPILQPQQGLSAPATLGPTQTPLPPKTSAPTPLPPPETLSPPATTLSPTATPAPMATPTPPATPAPTATDTGGCPLTAGWLLVYFAVGVTYEREVEIVEEVGARIIPVMLPLPLIEGAGSVEFVGVPEGEELEFAKRFEAYDEVVAAKTNWPGCLPNPIPTSG